MKKVSLVNGGGANNLTTNVTITLGGAVEETGKPNPTSAVGYYLGTKSFEKLDTRSNEMKTKTLNFLLTGDGIIGVWGGKSVIDSGFSKADIGVKLEIEYLGLTKSKKPGGYKYHNFRFDAVPEDTLSFEELAKYTSGLGIGGDTSEKADMDSEEDTDEDVEDSVPYKSPAAPAIAAAKASEAKQSSVLDLARKVRK